MIMENRISYRENTGKIRIRKYSSSTRRKGQFFIISAVIIVSMLLMVSYNFSGFGGISLTGIAEMTDFEYLGMIKKSLNDTVKNSDCEKLEEDILAAEGFFSKRLAEQGIELSAKHEIVSCKNVRFSFNLSSQNFFSATEFAYP